MSSKPKRTYNQKSKQNISIFGYITADTLGDTNIIYGENPKVNLEVYSIAVNYFPDITAKVKVSLKIGEVPQITLSIKLKSKTEDNIFVAFCKDLIRLYKLDNTNISVFYKEGDKIVNKFVRSYNTQQRERLQFIDDTD